MSKSFSPSLFRAQFPAINQAGVYLDSAATALKPQALLDATLQYYAENGASVHRSNYSNALSATQCFEKARELAAQFINAESAKQIVWTKGTTESINLIAQSYARPNLQAGDEIIVCETEHHANLIPWQMVAQQTGAKLIKLPMVRENTTNRFLPDIDALPNIITSKSKILAIGQMSNVTGGMPDLAYAIKLAHQHNMIVVVDGAQGVVHSPADVQALDIDFYAFSAHKLYGPTGVGVLYGKKALLEQMQPWQGGGKILTQATFDDFKADEVPYKFEAGTPNIAGIIGFYAVLNWLQSIDVIEAENYSCQLAQLAHEKLSTLPGFISYNAGKSSLVTFNFADHHHSDIAELLAEQGIAIRSGQHCAHPLIQALGVTGTLRASFAPYNQESDIDALYQALKHALAILADD